MLDPGTWAAIAAIATITGAGVSAYGAYSQGQSQKQASQYNARVAENNAIAARNAAAIREQNQREKDRFLLATMRTRAGASGISLEGSPLLTLSEAARQSEIDALNVRYGGEVEERAWRSEADLQRQYAKQYGTGGALSAGATLLTGAGQAGMGYASYKGWTAK